LEEENEKLTQDEPTLSSKVDRLEAQLKEAKDTNKVLEDALAKQAEEKKRGEQSLEPSSRLQPPPARKEICTHKAQLATLREENSDARAETCRLQEEMRNMQRTIITFSLSASQADFELNQAKEKAAELAQILREQLSFARNSVRQFNRANDTLRDQKSHLETTLKERLEASKQLYQKIAGLEKSLAELGQAKAKSEAEFEQKITGLEKSLEELVYVKAKIQAELRALKTTHQLETGGLQARIVHLEQGNYTLSEDKKIDDEDKRRLEHEINCLKRQYERKMTGPKEKNPILRRSRMRTHSRKPGRTRIRKERDRDRLLSPQLRC
jgi:chromosome segregation ATPase